jgi:hypothetical protein
MYYRGTNQKLRKNKQIGIYTESEHKDGIATSVKRGE